MDCDVLYSHDNMSDKASVEINKLMIHLLVRSTTTALVEDVARNLNC